MADKLKSGWSWFTQSATAVIDKAKANIAKDSAPKLYSRDSPTPTRLYNPDAARAASANDKVRFPSFARPSSAPVRLHGVLMVLCAALCVDLVDGRIRIVENWVPYHEYSDRLWIHFRPHAGLWVVDFVDFVRSVVVIVIVPPNVVHWLHEVG